MRTILRELWLRLLWQREYIISPQSDLLTAFGTEVATVNYNRYYQALGFGVGDKIRVAPYPLKDAIELPLHISKRWASIIHPELTNHDVKFCKNGLRKRFLFVPDVLYVKKLN